MTQLKTKMDLDTIRMEWTKRVEVTIQDEHPEVKETLDLFHKFIILIDSHQDKFIPIS